VAVKYTFVCKVSHRCKLAKVLHPAISLRALTQQEFFLKCDFYVNNALEIVRQELTCTLTIFVDHAVGCVPYNDEEAQLEGRQCGQAARGSGEASGHTTAHVLALCHGGVGYRK
jgi:hypothetical protein